MSKNKDYLNFNSPPSPIDTREHYRTAVGERLRVARQLQVEFAAAAEDLPVILASSMKDGRVPPVISEGMIFRSDPPRPVFLEGDIPPSAISVKVDDSLGDRFIFIDAYTDPDSRTDVYDISDKSHGAFTAVGERSFAELGELQMRDAILARLDETLAPFAQEPRQS